MRLRSKSIFVYLLVVLIGFSVAAEAKNYSIGVVGYADFNPFVVADVKGFFAEEGVDIELKYYISETDWLNAFMHQRHDITSQWGSNHIGLYADGVNVVSIGAYAYEEGSLKIIAKPEVTPQNFTAQKFGAVFDVFPVQWILWEYSKPNNIKMDDISIVILNSEDMLVKNFNAGRLQIVMLRGSYADRAIAEGNGVVLYSSTAQHALFSILMYKDTYQASPKEDLKKMYRALIRAVKWVQEPANEEELFAIVMEKFAEDPMYANIQSLEAFRELQSVTFIAPEDLYYYNTTFLKASYDRMKTVLADLGKPHDFHYDEVVDTSALLEVLEEMGLIDTPTATE